MFEVDGKNIELKCPKCSSRMNFINIEKTVETYDCALYECKKCGINANIFYNDNDGDILAFKD